MGHHQREVNKRQQLPQVEVLPDVVNIESQRAEARLQQQKELLPDQFPMLVCTQLKAFDDELLWYYALQSKKTLYDIHT